MSIPVITGRDGQGNPIWTDYAMGPTSDARFNVWDYWEQGDGIAPDNMIARAIAAAQAAGGGIVYFPRGTYTISQTITVSNDNIWLMGDGWNTIITPASTFTGSYLVYVESGGNFRYGIVISEIFFNVNNLGTLGGLNLEGTYHALVDHVRVRYAPGIAVFFSGLSGKFGAYNCMRNCTITDGNSAASVGVETSNSEWLLIEGCTFVTFTSAGAYGVVLNNLNCIVRGCQFDNIDTAVYMSYSNRSIISGCQFDRGYTRFIDMRGNQASVIEACIFNTRTGTGNEVIYVTDSNNRDNVIMGCSVEPASGWTDFINESGNTGTPGNTYTGNDTGGLPMVMQAASGGVARGNRGYNPVGYLSAQPAIPASGTPYTNTSGVDCTVYVTGGTVSAIAVAGSNTGLTSGAVRVPAGSTITLTYSAAPSWGWFGD